MKKLLANRFRQVVAKFCLVFLLIIGFIVLANRIPDRYVCLTLTEFTRDGQQSPWVIDLLSGHLMAVHSSEATTYSFPSPDGQSAAYLKAQSEDGRNWNLGTELVNSQTDTDDKATVIAHLSQSDGLTFPGSVVWSNDSRQIAFGWRDANQQLSFLTATATGLHLRTITLSNRLSSPLVVQPLTLHWSPDGQYISLEAAQDKAPAQQNIWSTAAGASEEPIFPTAQHVTATKWGPQGHLLASVQKLQNGTSQLQIWSPDKVLTIPLHLVDQQVMDSITWSPNGNYLVLRSNYPCDGDCAPHWSFDVFRSDGTMVAQAIRSIDVGVNNTVPFSHDVYVSAWSADSRYWVFLQPTAQADRVALIKFNLSTTSYEMIADNVVASLAHELFFVPLVYYSTINPAERPQADVAGYRLVLPTWHNDKIRIELADIDGQHRTTLVDGADSIIKPPRNMPGYTTGLWSPYGGVVNVVWTTKDASNHEITKLTWARPDSTERHEIDDGFTDITQFDYSESSSSGAEQWLIFSAKHDSNTALFVADAATGHYRQLISNPDPKDHWSFYKLPTSNSAFLQSSSFSTQAMTASLYLVSLKDFQMRQLAIKDANYPSLSPDEKQLAFMIVDPTTTKTVLHVINIADNSLAFTLSLPSLNTPYDWFQSWSRCH